MPTLVFRSVGMSHLIEGISASGLDSERFRDAMADRHGPAMAVLSTPRSLEAADPDLPSPVDAIIVDRNAETRETLKDWLVDYVRDLGYCYAGWSESGLGESLATLHFHLQE